MKIIASIFYLLVIFYSTEKLWAAEGSRYYNFSWLDPDKEIYVLQNRKYRKKNRAYTSLGGGMTTNGAFTNAQNAQFRAGYFFSEDFGLEVLYSQNFGETNSTYDAVKTNGVIPFYRNVKDYYGGMLLWSPFYTKINTFNAIMYFDWVFGLGYGRVEEENNVNDFKANRLGQGMTNETHGGPLWNTHLRWYLSEMFALRLDLTGIHYKAEKPGNRTLESKETWNQNLDLTLSLVLTF